VYFGVDVGKKEKEGTTTRHTPGEKKKAFHSPALENKLRQLSMWVQEKKKKSESGKGERIIAARKPGS